MGLFGVMRRRDFVSVLISLELMANSVLLNLTAFNRAWGIEITKGAFSTAFNVYSAVGQIFAMFAFLIIVAETVIGLAIFVAVCRELGAEEIEELRELKDER